MDSYEFLEVGVTDGIAMITMNRPPVNILHIPMMTELNSALETVIEKENLAAVVIRAEGKAFSAGVDVSDHVGNKMVEMIRQFHGIFRKLASTDALTIAAVGKAALGGGCEVATFCDIVLASDQAKFGQPEVSVGVLAPVAACLFPLQVGIKKAVELNALGMVIDAAEAHRIGLVNQVWPASEFEACVEEYLDRIRKLSRPVVRMAKRATVLVDRERILDHLDRVEKLYLDDLMKLSDAHEGIAAFMEKREPTWKHE